MTTSCTSGGAGVALGKRPGNADYKVAGGTPPASRFAGGIAIVDSNFNRIPKIRTIVQPPPGPQVGLFKSALAATESADTKSSNKKKKPPKPPPPPKPKPPVSTVVTLLPCFPRTTLPNDFSLSGAYEFMHFSGRSGTYLMYYDASAKKIRYNRVTLDTNNLPTSLKTPASGKEFDGVITAVKRAWNAWGEANWRINFDPEVGYNRTIVSAEPVPDSMPIVEGENEADGRNVISWISFSRDPRIKNNPDPIISTASGNSGVIGLTYLHADRGQLNRVIEADIYLNSDNEFLSTLYKYVNQIGRPFSDNACGGGSSAYDFQAILTHELGHEFGLAHTEENYTKLAHYGAGLFDQTMFPATAKGEIRDQLLGPGDGRGALVFGNSFSEGGPLRQATLSPSQNVSPGTLFDFWESFAEAGTWIVKYDAIINDAEKLQSFSPTLTISGMDESTIDRVQYEVFEFASGVVTPAWISRTDIKTNSIKVDSTNGQFVYFHNKMLELKKNTYYLWHARYWKQGEWSDFSLFSIFKTAP